MKIIFLLLPLLAFVACGPNAAEIENKIKADIKRQQDSIENVENIREDSIESAQNNQTRENNTKNAETAWNYSGVLDKYPIKAQINYGEGSNSEGSGALQIPITGYYFYESKNEKIPIEGSSNGSGSIYFVAHTSGGDETFDGEYTGSMLEDFSGTWSKGNKQLNFSLNSKK
jgi:hypothetical protein